MYLPVPRLYNKREQKLRYRCLFIIHVNFDHAWAEHYPITSMATGCQQHAMLCMIQSCSVADLWQQVPGDTCRKPFNFW